MTRILYFIAIIAISFTACKGNENSEKAAAGSEMNTDSSKAKNSVEYTCPMHSEVHSDSPGQCPHCGMDLESKS